MSTKLVSVLMSLALFGLACGASVTVEAGSPTSTPTEQASVEPELTDAADATSEPALEPTVPDGEDADQATPTALPSPTPPATPVSDVPAEAMSVTYTETYETGKPAIARLTASRDRSWRLERGVQEINVFSAPVGVQTTWYDGGVEPPSAWATVDIGLGGPDGGGWYWLPGVELTDAVWMSLETGAATPVEYMGRQALQLDTELVPNGIGGGPDQVSVVIDAETGVLLSYDSTANGALWASVTATELEVYEESPDVFSLGPDVELESDPWSLGFQRTTLADVEAAVGYVPPLPATLPDGYELTGVAVAPGETAGVTGVEGSNPPNTDVVHLEYSNGWRHLVITTRRASDAPYPWVDPFSGEGTFYEIDTVALSSGAFGGAAAEVSVSPETQPHLWAQANGLVLTIDGPLTAAQMVAVAESLNVG